VPTHWPMRSNEDARGDKIVNDDTAESDAILRLLKVGRHEKAGYQCPQCGVAAVKR
jgi:hypothetical protein